MADQLGALRERVPEIVERDPGLKIGEIAERLGVPVAMAQVIVRPLISEEALETTGQRKGTRYYLAGSAPKRGQRGTAQAS